MLLAILVTLIGILLICTVLYAAMMNGSRNNLLLYEKIVIVVIVVLVSLAWVRSCRAAIPDTVKAMTAHRIIECVENPQLTTAEKVDLIKGELDLYHMKILGEHHRRQVRVEAYKAKLRSRIDRQYCESCGFSHGRFYHAMIGKE